MTKIVEFRAKNTRILKCVRIAPDGNVVIIGGENESGKTTVLDDIELIFSGAKSKKMPKVPIRGGQTSGRTSVKLDNGMVLEREWSASGTRLVIKGPDGKKLPGGAQEIADKFFSLVAFDPLEFADKMDDKKQAEVLRQLVGLDFTALDARRSHLYSEREEQGRDLARRKGQLATMPAKADAPESEVSVAVLVAEKDAAERTNREHAKVYDGLERARRLREGKEEALEVAKRALATAQAAYDGAVVDEDAADAATKSLSPDIDVSPIVAKIQGAEDVNRAVRAQRERAKVADDVERMEEARRALTDQIEAIDKQKSEALAAVKWPVDGLGFNSDGVTYKGFPFSQASKAARCRVSISIGSALNPELPCMLLRDASALDDEAMALLAKLAEEKDQMLWIERVGKNDVGAIILEDGEIVGRVVEPGKVEPLTSEPATDRTEGTTT